MQLSAIDQIKFNHCDFIQIVLFDAQGHVIDSCDTLFPLKANQENIFERIYVLESIQNDIQALDSKLEIKMVEFSHYKRDGFFDFLIHPSNIKGEFHLIIKDQTQVYEYMQHVQTQKNKSIIKNEQLQRLNQKISDQNQQIKLFSSFITHDIKEPITTIEGIADMLNAEFEELIGQDQLKQGLNYIKRNAVWAQRLINDVYNYSKLEQNIVLYKVVSLHSLVAQIIETYSINHDVNFTNQIEPSTKIISDPILIEQILNNLISNSIKYKQANKPAEITIQFKELETEYILTIIDNGKGIEKTKIKEIFKPFYMIDKQPEQMSTGIGLSIVDRAIKKLKGKITVDSILGKGSTFKVFFKKKVD